MKKLFSTDRTKKSSKSSKLLSSINLDDRQVLDPSSISLGPLIGEGGFAKVHRCDLDGRVAVAKLIDANRMNEEMTYLLTNECTIWARLEHRNIVSFFGMTSSPSGVLLVCEFMAEGSLQDSHKRLRNSKADQPTQIDLCVKLQQVADGMAYLHKLDPPVLHRDLKSANILIADGGERLAIADFGLARLQANSGKKMTAETGSYRWMAPEVIRHEEYDKRCDVYSFAILAWEMLTYRIPFDNMMPVEAAFAVAREAKRPPIPQAWQQLAVADMLKACWHQDAFKRPDFDTICVALQEELEMLHQNEASASGSAPADALANALPVLDVSRA